MDQNNKVEKQNETKLTNKTKQNETKPDANDELNPEDVRRCISEIFSSGCQLITTIKMITCNRVFFL